LIGSGIKNGDRGGDREQQSMMLYGMIQRVSARLHSSSTYLRELSVVFAERFHGIQEDLNCINKTMYMKYEYPHLTSLLWTAEHQQKNEK
jgi:hypothetical protein